MHIESEEDIWNRNGDCIYDDVIILSWRQIGSEAIQEFADRLDKIGVDLVEYNLGGSDHCFRIVFNKESFRLKMPMWSENY
mgnify:CR=1 FL=1